MTGPQSLFERNREVFAERLGWPDGAVQACRDLERRWPHWLVLYSRGGLPMQPDPGYVAYLSDPHFTYQPRVSAATAGGLDELLAAEDEVRARRQLW